MSIENMLYYWNQRNRYMRAAESSEDERDAWQEMVNLLDGMTEEERLLISCWRGEET